MTSGEIPNLMADRSEVRTRPTLDDLRREGATTSVVRAGEALGLSRATAYRMAHNGTIPTLQIGRSLRVPVDALIRTLTVEHLDLQLRAGEAAS